MGVVSEFGCLLCVVVVSRKSYRSVRRYTTVQVQKVKIFRFDASLNFVNRAYFEECVLKVLFQKEVCLLRTYVNSRMNLSGGERPQHNPCGHCVL